MAIVEIDKYSLTWNHQTKDHAIKITLKNKEKVSLRIDDAAEFSALALLLNETPIYYNTRTGEILSGWEPTGGC